MSVSNGDLIMSALKKFKPVKLEKDAFWEALGISARGLRLHQDLERGFSFKTYKALLDVTGIESKELAALVHIPRATLQRRAQVGRFKTDESDRLFRFAKLNKAALDLFEGDKDAARRWLHSHVKGLGGRRPLDMLETSVEYNVVLDLIGRLEYGIPA